MEDPSRTAVAADPYSLDLVLPLGAFITVNSRMAHSSYEISVIYRASSVKLVCCCRENDARISVKSRPGCHPTLQECGKIQYQGSPPESRYRQFRSENREALGSSFCIRAQNAWNSKPCEGRGSAKDVILEVDTTS